jgi:hypothetical protein
MRSGYRPRASSLSKRYDDRVFCRHTRPGALRRAAPPNTRPHAPAGAAFPWLRSRAHPPSSSSSDAPYRPSHGAAVCAPTQVVWNPWPLSFLQLPQYKRLQSFSRTRRRSARRYIKLERGFVTGLEGNHHRRNHERPWTSATSKLHLPVTHLYVGY